MKNNNFRSRFDKNRYCGRIDKDHYFYGENVPTGDNQWHCSKTLLTVGENGVTNEHLAELQKFDNAEAQDIEDDARNWETICETFHESTASLEDDLFMDEEPVNDMVSIFMKNVLPKLSEDQKNLIYDLYGTNKDLKELAAESGTTYQAIQNRRKKLHNRIEKLMAEYGYSKSEEAHK
ncbi:MAG: hypothetical protein K6A29_02855 [Lachnospiraceae bacterium]|nr:hypothetical protein [Lachnospiraceae bacterium]